MGRVLGDGPQAIHCVKQKGQMARGLARTAAGKQSDERSALWDPEAMAQFGAAGRGLHQAGEWMADVSGVDAVAREELGLKGKMHSSRWMVRRIKGSRPLRHAQTWGATR